MAIESFAPTLSRITSTSPQTCYARRSANSRRRSRTALVVVGFIAAVVSVCAWSQSVADGDDFRVTLLGTGSPQPTINRFGPGVLVQAGGQTLVIDCGRDGQEEGAFECLSHRLLRGFDVVPVNFPDGAI